MPALGTINIIMPSDWAASLPDNVKIERITGQFTSERLIYQESFIWEPSGNMLLKVTPEFEWPAKQQLKIKITNVVNPSGINETKSFYAFTNYDSEMIDQSDITDPASRV